MPLKLKLVLDSYFNISDGFELSYDKIGGITSRDELQATSLREPLNSTQTACLFLSAQSRLLGGTKFGHDNYHQNVAYIFQEIPFLHQIMLDMV